MIREQLLEFASQSPDFGQGIDIIEERLSRTAMVPEDLNEAIEMLEAALQNPAMYAEMVQAAIADGLIDEGDAPAEFDAVFIISILLALYGLQDRATAQGYARGGLTVAARHLANQGQGGDSMLAHINPREAEILKRMGGQGTVNPNTGLAEYKSFKKIFKTILPVALSIFMPTLGLQIGTAMGLSGTAAAVVGGGVLGAGTAAITGGDPLKGAFMGGLGAGGGQLAGNFVNQGMNLGLSAPMAATLGSGLVGGVAGAVSGQGFGQGALQGVGGQFLKNIAPQGAPEGLNTFNAALQSGANTAGNMLTAGYTPEQSVTGGFTSGLFQAGKKLFGNAVKASDAVNEGAKVNNRVGDNYTQYAEDETVLDMKSGDILVNRMTNQPITGIVAGDTNIYENGIPVGKITENLDISTTGIETGNIGQSGGDVDPDDLSFVDKTFNFIKEKPLDALALGTLAVGSLFPDDVNVAMSGQEMSPEQKEYFNKSLNNWDWDAIRNAANQNNMGLGQFMSSNFNNLTSGQYNMQPVKSDFSGYYRGGPMRMGQGGALGKASRYVRGEGTGRSDEIPAYLSDGEYVIDAETVSMLGDGSSKAGAEALNGMRENIRSHKGKVLAKGNFSPDAKSPLTYLKEGMA